MKKVFFIFIILLFVGCTNNQPKKSVCQIDGTVAPTWVCNGGADMKDGIYGVGSAEKSPIGFEFQREAAIDAARNSIAREISVKVKNMFKTYLSSTGIGNNQTAEKVLTSVSKQIAYQTLNNSKLVKTWISPKGVMFVLVKMPKNVIKQSIKTTLHNDNALWQEFKAKKAQAELEKEIDKEFK